MKLWLDTDDENETHYLWECPEDQSVWCITCGDWCCDECGKKGPQKEDYNELSQNTT